MPDHMPISLQAPPAQAGASHAARPRLWARPLVPVMPLQRHEVSLSPALHAIAIAEPPPDLRGEPQLKSSHQSPVLSCPLPGIQPGGAPFHVPLQMHWLDPPEWAHPTGPPPTPSAAAPLQTVDASGPQPHSAAVGAGGEQSRGSAGAETWSSRDPGGTPGPHSGAGEKRDRAVEDSGAAQRYPEKGAEDSTAGQGSAEVVMRGKEGARGGGDRARGSDEGPPLAGLVRDSLAGPLSPEQQQEFLGAIGSAAGLRTALQHLRPSQFPDLVNQNPNVAADLLRKMREPGASTLGEYTKFEGALLRMELSLQSMEVVNTLVSALAETGESATALVLEFVSLCIPACSQIKDKAVQSRQVRLLCMFIQLQLRNKTIHVQDVFIEVQAFCIEFSRIKEAAGLFKLLKSLDKE